MDLKTYYRIVSKADKNLELKRNAGLHNYYCTYEEDGTKFPVTWLEKVKELAKEHNGIIYEVKEERTLII